MRDDLRTVSLAAGLEFQCLVRFLALGCVSVGNLFRSQLSARNAKRGPPKTTSWTNSKGQRDFGTEHFEAPFPGQILGPARRTHCSAGVLFAGPKWGPEIGPQTGPSPAFGCSMPNLGGLRRHQSSTCFANFETHSANLSGKGEKVGPFFGLPACLDLVKRAHFRVHQGAPFFEPSRAADRFFGSRHSC